MLFSHHQQHKAELNNFNHHFSNNRDQHYRYLHLSKMNSIHQIPPKSFPSLDGGGPLLEQLKENFVHDLSPRRLANTTSVHKLLIELTQQNLLNLERLNSIKLYLSDSPEEHGRLDETAKQLEYHLPAPDSNHNHYGIYI